MRDSTAVVIALIGVIVPATGLYLTTREKQQQKVVSAAAPSSTPAADRDAAPPAQADQDHAVPNAAPTSTGSSSTAVAQPPAIAGLWTASDDYRFTFSQTGTRFSYRARQGAADQAAVTARSTVTG